MRIKEIYRLMYIFSEIEYNTLASDITVLPQVFVIIGQRGGEEGSNIWM